VSRGEFERIDLFLRAFEAAGGATHGRAVLLGAGDDAAILAPGPALAVTTDALVEDVHFRRQWATWAQIGHKALAVNLSDLAAMGARPSAFVCALGLPPEVDDQALAEMAGGMGKLAARFGAILAGGNFSRARETSVTITAFGEMGDRVLRRDAARPGDLVVLAGEVGTAAAELAWLEKGRALPPGRSALLEPEPLVESGLCAARHASCGIDVSDGLAQDLGHLARASGVAIRLHFAAIPQSQRFGVLTKDLPAAEKARFTVAGGDDYALVLAVPPEPARRLCVEIGGTVLGRVESGEGVAIDGLPAGTSVGGHNHFRR